MGAPQQCIHDMRTPEDAEKEEEEEEEEEELQDLVFSSAFQLFLVLKHGCVCVGTPKHMLNAVVAKIVVFNWVLVRDVSGNTAVW